MPPINPLNINAARGGSATDFQTQGDRTIARQLGGGFKVKQTGGMSLPMNNTTPAAPTGVAVTSFGAPPKPSHGSPSISAPGATTQGVLNTAAALATEDTLSPFPKPPTETVEYIKGPDGVIRPTITISGANWVGDEPPMGSAAPPPMPEPETPSYTSPPLVSAPPTKKKSPVLALAVIAALIALFS